MKKQEKQKNDNKDKGALELRSARRSSFRRRMEDDDAVTDGNHDHDETLVIKPQRRPLAATKGVEEVKMEEAEQPEEDNDDDDDDDDAQPGAFRVGGMGGAHDFTSDETLTYESRDGYDHDDATTTAAAAETTTLSVVEAEQVDEEALQQHYLEKARKKILQRIHQETTTHATQINPIDNIAGNDIKGRRLYRWLFLFILLVLILCGILVPILVRSSSKQQEQHKRQTPAFQDEDDTVVVELSDLEFAKEQILNFLSDSDVVTRNDYETTYFQDSSSAQSKALEWLVYHDPAMLTIQETEFSILLDRYVLAVLYFSTNGPNWINPTQQLNEYDNDTAATSDDNYFLTKSHVCDWDVIGCDVTNSIVVLAIESNNLQGTIPMELSFVTSLEEIRLAFNNLSGTIPSELGLLTQLEWLQLSLNDLTGSIPVEVQNLFNLEKLYLTVNQLTGTIPTGIMQLPLLSVFHVGENLLSGTIPEMMNSQQQEQSMVRLALRDNMLTGSIPNAITTLTNLEEFWLHKNLVTGTIPLDIGMLTKLEVLLLDLNALSGILPTSIGALEYLRLFAVDQNYQLNGTIPTEFGKLSSLTSAYLTLNQFTGTIPTEIGQLTNLNGLFLDGNPITGTLPSTFSQLTMLEKLGISYTSLTGDLDIPICNQTNRIKHLSADCRGQFSEVNCSCCTTCCHAKASCDVDYQQICNNYARDLEDNLLHNQGTCSCTDDNQNTLCDVTECPICKEDLSVCGITTEFRQLYTELVVPIGWISTIKYQSGRHANHTASWEFDTLSRICNVYVNGVKCNRCTMAACPDGFRAKEIDCNNILNVDGPLTYFSCSSPREESSVLDIIQWIDTDSWTGCPFVPMEYIR